jgi:hypothetical protein
LAVNKVTYITLAVGKGIVAARYYRD